MDKRLLFLDLDGTLLNDSKEITDGNLFALNQALERGHGVIITTGRPLDSAQQLARRLKLDRPGCYLIAYNGGVVYDWAKPGTIGSRALPLPQVVRLFEEANRRGLHVQTYDEHHVLVEPRCETAALHRYCSLTGSVYRVIGNVRQDLQAEPAKVLLLDFADQKALRGFREWVLEHMEQEVDCFFSAPQILDVMPKGVNKGVALQMLCAALGVEEKNAVAVGDAANDLSMIRAAGIGVAMANGTDEVKSAAQYVTERDNNHDGVAEVVDRFLGAPVGAP